MPKRRTPNLVLHVKRYVVRTWFINTLTKTNKSRVIECKSRNGLSLSVAFAAAAIVRASSLLVVRRAAPREQRGWWNGWISGGSGDNIIFVRNVRRIRKIRLKSTWTFLLITFKLFNLSDCEFLYSHLHNISDRLIPYMTFYVQPFAL
jgi:hypothetical protein